MEEFYWGLNACAEFVRLQQTPPESLTDIPRAHRFFYLQKTCYGGIAKNYDYATKARARLDSTRFDAHLEKVQKRLHSVNVEHLPWQNASVRYDRPHTLFYLDPPCHGHEDVYGKGIFAERDFAEIAHTLARIKGQFVLSLNDTPQVRHWFKAFIPYKIETAYASGTKHRGIRPHPVARAMRSDSGFCSFEGQPSLEVVARGAMLKSISQGNATPNATLEREWHRCQRGRLHRTQPSEAVHGQCPTKMLRQRWQPPMWCACLGTCLLTRLRVPVAHRTCLQSQAKRARS